METKKIVHSRDVMWLGYKFHKSSKNSFPTMPAPEDDHKHKEEIAPAPEDDHKNEE